MGFNLSTSIVIASVAVILYVAASPGNSRPIFRRSFLAVFFLILIFSIAHLIADFFTNRGIDESVVFHLVYGLKGAGLSEYSTLITISIAALVVAISLVLGIGKAGQFGIRGSWLIYPALSLLLFSLAIHPVTQVIFKRTATVSFTEKFADYYHEPVIKQGNSGNRKNLIFIYAEGLERTWLDEKLFPGLTPNLRVLGESAFDFRNIRQMPYTGWTMAGIVASQCGLPLVIASHGNGMSGMDSFLPGAVCMGDLLNSIGYHLEFFGGADLEFAGKGNFFNTHEFAAVNGRKELKEFVEPDYMSGWGLYDDTLLQLAYDRFIELSESENPFALMMLTLDTHHPKGMPSQKCISSDFVTHDRTTPMHLAVACSDHLISKFIHDIRNSPFSENTLIVLVSDHLAMKNEASTHLDKTDRKLLFMILPGWGDTRKYIDFPGSIFDVGATTLGFLGFELSLGFGRNLLKEKTVFESNQRTSDLFKFWATHFDEFWEFPSLEKGISFDSAKDMLRVGDSSIKTPVLILYDENLDTRLVFDDFAQGETDLLDETYRELQLGTPFAYVADCVKFSETSHFPREEVCLLYGRKGDRDNRLIYLRDSPKVGRENFVTVVRQQKILDR